MIQDIEFEIIDSLIEKPYQFMLAGKVFALYPKTLGR